MEQGGHVLPEWSFAEEDDHPSQFEIFCLSEKQRTPMCIIFVQLVRLSLFHGGPFFNVVSVCLRTALQIAFGMEHECRQNKRQ